eukprot:UN04803
MSPYATPKKPNIITTKTDIFSFGLMILFIVNGGEKLFALNEKEKKQNLNKKDTTRLLYAKLMNFDMKYYLLKLYAIDGKIDGDLYDLLSKCWIMTKINGYRPFKLQHINISSNVDLSDCMKTLGINYKTKNE